MRGTERIAVLPATVGLRVSYARERRVLRACYGMCGTEREYGATNLLVDSSTERAYCATSLLFNSGTEAAYGATNSLVLREGMELQTRWY
eukprot:2637624-Rhodomonas_salina.2